MTTAFVRVVSHVSGPVNKSHSSTYSRLWKYCSTMAVRCLLTFTGDTCTADRETLRPYRSRSNATLVRPSGFAVGLIDGWNPQTTCRKPRIPESCKYFVNSTHQFSSAWSLLKYKGVLLRTALIVFWVWTTACLGLSIIKQRTDAAPEQCLQAFHLRNPPR